MWHNFIVVNHFVFTVHVPTKRTLLFFLQFSLGVLMRGLSSFSNCAYRRTLHGDLSLAVAHDDDGVLFKNLLVGTCVEDFSLLVGSLELFERSCIAHCELSIVARVVPTELKNASSVYQLTLNTSTRGSVSFFLCILLHPLL